MKYPTLLDATLAQRALYEKQGLKLNSRNEYMRLFREMSVACCHPSEIHQKPYIYQLHYNPEQDFLYRFGYDPDYIGSVKAERVWFVEVWGASMRHLPIVTFHYDVYYNAIRGIHPPARPLEI